jgi:hypothetical protein
MLGEQCDVSVIVAELIHHMKFHALNSYRLQVFIQAGTLQ